MLALIAASVSLAQEQTTATPVVFADGISDPERFTRKRLKRGTWTFVRMEDLRSKPAISLEGVGAQPCTRSTSPVDLSAPDPSEGLEGSAVWKELNDLVRGPDHKRDFDKTETRLSELREEALCSIPPTNADTLAQLELWEGYWALEHRRRNIEDLRQPEEDNEYLLDRAHTVFRQAFLISPHIACGGGFDEDIKQSCYKARRQQHRQEYSVPPFSLFPKAGMFLVDGAVWSEHNLQPGQHAVHAGGTTFWLDISSGNHLGFVAPALYPEDALGWVTSQRPEQRSDLAQFFLSGGFPEGTELIVLHDDRAWVGVSGGEEWEPFAPRRLWRPILTSALGGVGMIVGGALVYNGRQQVAQRSAAFGEPGVSDKSHPDLMRQLRQADLQWGIGSGLLGASGGAVVGGLLWTARLNAR